jgi:ketosteroid isomerase-like protein
VEEQQRIDLVRRAMAAVAPRDTAAFLAEVTEDCELRPLMSVWPQPYRGHEGIEQWFVDLAGVWDEFSVEPDDFRFLDDHTLLVPLTWRGRGAGEKNELEGPSVSLWRFRGELAVSVHLYPDEARALAAYEAS